MISSYIEKNINGYSPYSFFEDNSMVKLKACVEASGTMVYTTLVDADTEVAYQVPSGKKLVLSRVITISANCNNNLQVKNGDNNVGLNSTTAPTNLTDSGIPCTLGSTTTDLNVIATIIGIFNSLKYISVNLVTPTSGHKVYMMFFGRLI
jgi:hypothetical protein